MGGGQGGECGKGGRGTDSRVGFSASNKTVIPCSFTGGTGD